MLYLDTKALSKFIEELGKKQWEIFASEEYRDKDFTATIKNPIPEFVEKKKLWSLFGIFTGYCVMKFFKDKLIAPKARIVKSITIAQIALDKMKKIDKSKEIVTIKDKIFRTKDFIKLLEDTEKWLQNYKNTPWDECIIDIWGLSTIDQFFRFNQYPRTEVLDKTEIYEISLFLKRLLNWLKKEFSLTKEIFINPKIGISKIIRADIDLIIDNVLWDIKTTKYPEKATQMDINYLIACAALVYYHNQEEERYFPTIEYIGYIFPQQLQVWKKSIKNYSNNTKSSIILKLKEFSKK